MTKPNERPGDLGVYINGHFTPIPSPTLPIDVGDRPWRGPAMTYEGGPRVCGYCAADMHNKCDGLAWCEARQQGADCPCGHPTHQEER